MAGTLGAVTAMGAKATVVGMASPKDFIYIVNLFNWADCSV
jgi:hypothetical protein